MSDTSGASSFLGFAFVLDHDLLQGTAEFRLHGRTVARIINLKTETDPTGNWLERASYLVASRESG